MSRTFVSMFALVLLCSGLVFAERRIIRPKGTEAGAAYSPGVLVDGTLYVSGQGGEDPAGKIPATFEGEVKQAFDNIGVVLKEAGMSSADVVSVQVFLTNADQFQRMNVVYKDYFKEPRPVRTTVVVAKLVGSGSIEITVIAKK
jgi:2-iminobutanoate/2-iminopropanoate deaminase